MSTDEVPYLKASFEPKSSYQKFTEGNTFRMWDVVFMTPIRHTLVKNDGF